MLDILAFLFCSIASIVLYTQWKIEQRLKLSALNTSGTAPSRQSRRYKDSWLFSMLCHEEDVSFPSFSDRFSSLADVEEAMHRGGLQRCRLILGVDFTASNEWQGRQSFQRNCLHDLLNKGMNPYQKVISTIGRAILPFCEANAPIYAFGFGDAITKDRSVFSLRHDSPWCSTLDQVLVGYAQQARAAHFSGPTSFAPILNKSVEIVRQTRNRHHVLLIVSDGQMTDDESTVSALIQASLHPLSIVMVGVGDGPWDKMEEFDDFLPRRKFDNFQFVDYNKTMHSSSSSPTAKGSKRSVDARLALHAFMELPDQYRAMKSLGYVK